MKDEDFEFPDLLGTAYEWLIKYFADSAGKKAGEFYTPAEVGICVEICDPRENMSIYDMNMLLHGISHADIRQADTIKEPLHLAEDNELKRLCPTGFCSVEARNT